MDSLAFRKDVRTVDEFAADIRQFTANENLWGQIINIDLQHKGFSCTVRDHGVDSTGSLITEKLENLNADKQIVFSDSDVLSVEISAHRYTPPKTFTFKTDKLLRCADGFVDLIAVPWRYKNHFLDSACAVYLLENVTAQTDAFGWGGKKVVRIPYYGEHDSVIGLCRAGYLSSEPWSEPAMQQIQKWQGFLFADRPHNF